MSHLSEIGAAIKGVRQVSAGIPIIATMTFDTRGHTMMGVSPEQAVASLAAWGADAIGGNCGNGPDELLPVIERMHAAAPDITLVAKSNAGMPELVDMRAVYRADPATMAEAGLDFQSGRRPDHRGVLREHAGSPQGDGGGPGGSSLTGRRSPASIRVARRFSAGVSGHEYFGA